MGEGNEKIGEARRTIERVREKMVNKEKQRNERKVTSGPSEGVLSRNAFFYETHKTRV